jgi:hypothetical protein
VGVAGQGGETVSNGMKRFKKAERNSKTKAKHHDAIARSIEQN